MTDTIPRAAFNAAVQRQIESIKPKLNALKALLTTPQQAAAEIELHRALNEALAAADKLGGTDAHTNGGGDGKTDPPPND